MCVTEKKDCLCVCVGVCVCVRPFSVSIDVERGGGRGGQDLQQTFSTSPQVLNLGKHSLLHIQTYCSAHKHSLFFSYCTLLRHKYHLDSLIFNTLSYFVLHVNFKNI